MEKGEVGRSMPCCGGTKDKQSASWEEQSVCGPIYADRQELYAKVEEKIAACEEKYEKAKQDVYFSTVYHNELETWRSLLKGLKDEEQADVVMLQTKLRERLCELEAAKEREEHCPSFSWYGEHYHYLVLEGACDAYRGMIGLLAGKKGE